MRKGADPFPELKWNNGNNSCLSLHVLAETCRVDRTRVVSSEIDSTGRLVLRIDLPGSKTVAPRAFVR